MLPKHLIIKLAVLCVLTVGAIYTPPASAQWACDGGCVTFDDGSPGCARFTGYTGQGCKMKYVCRPNGAGGEICVNTCVSSKCSVVGGGTDDDGFAMIVE
jgi:hypothetical protein